MTSTGVILPPGPPRLLRPAGVDASPSSNWVTLTGLGNAAAAGLSTGDMPSCSGGGGGRDWPPFPGDESAPGAGRRTTFLVSGELSSERALTSDDRRLIPGGAALFRSIPPGTPPTTDASDAGRSLPELLLLSPPAPPCLIPRSNSSLARSAILDRESIDLELPFSAMGWLPDPSSSVRLSEAQRLMCSSMSVRLMELHRLCRSSSEFTDELSFRLELLSAELLSAELFSEPFTPELQSELLSSPTPSSISLRLPSTLLRSIELWVIWVTLE